MIDNIIIDMLFNSLNAAHFTHTDNDNIIDIHFNSLNAAHFMHTDDDNIIAMLAPSLPHFYSWGCRNLGDIAGANDTTVALWPWRHVPRERERERETETWDSNRKTINLSH